MSAAIHLAFDELQAVDLTLGLTVAPGGFQRSSNSRVIWLEANGEIVKLDGSSAEAGV